MRLISNKTISEYLDQQRIQHSMIGYQYLLVGLRAMLRGEIDRYRVSSIYDYVASTHGVTVWQVDRAMRSVIRKSSDPVTNKEFLMKALDQLLLMDDTDAELFKLTPP